MKEYIVVKTVFNNIVEYGKMFDSETDAIEQAEKLNQRAKENDWADVRFSVLPCEVTPKGGRMMQYIVVKVIVQIASYDIEYGKVFDSEHDAIRAAVELNQLARKLDWADIVKYMVLPKEAN